MTVRSFNSVNNGEDAIAQAVQQILDVLMGTTQGNIPVSLTAITDPTHPTLALRNRDPNGTALVIYDYTGENILVQIPSGGTLEGGASGSAGPTITGSRGGNSALASLLAALDALNLIQDGSTA